MDRKFIHLSEVEKFFALTKEQVLDEVELGNFNLYAWIDTNDAFAIRADNAILAQVSLKTCILLSNQLSKKLLLGDVKIQQLNGIPSTLFTNPIAAKTIFPDHDPGAFSEICGVPLELSQTKWVALSLNCAVPFTKAAKSAQQELQLPSTSSALDSIANALSAFSNTIDNGKKQLSLGYFTLKPSNIRLHVGKLKQHFRLEVTESLGTGNTVRNSLSNQSETGFKPNIATHVIERIQQRVLEKYPEAKAREVWNLIREDIRQENYQFDDDLVIHEISDQTIHYGDAQSLAYRRFQNMLSDTRKKMHG